MPRGKHPLNRKFKVASYHKQSKNFTLTQQQAKPLAKPSKQQKKRFYTRTVKVKTKNPTYARYSRRKL
jgi:hypothetical protein